MHETLEQFDEDQSVELSPRYAPMSVKKFIALHIVTLGFYDLVWFYRNWRYVKARDDSNIWPWARAVFIPPIWYYVLLIDIREKEQTALSGWLAVAYFMVFGTARLPDPYWLLGLLSFLPLLPFLLFVNQINREAGAAPPAYSKWRKRDVPVLAVGGAVLILVFAAAIGPSTRVLAGAEVPRRHVAFLQAIGLVESPGDVLFYYSPGFVSVKGEGTVLTAHGVSTYWTELPIGERHSSTVTLEDIIQVRPQWSQSWLDHTLIRLFLIDGSEFAFYLPSEDGGDRRFVAELRRLLEGVR